MRTRNALRRWAALTVGAAVAATSLSAVAATSPAGAADDTPNPPATVGATIDYFDDVYDGLGPNSVFETVTIERFEYILKTKPGNFAFLVGDPGDASTQATIAHIDTVAKDLGVDKIYNFTPKLDGDKVDVWDLSESNLRDAGLTQYTNLGNRLLNDYLNRDTTPQFTKDASSDPYLFVYNKDRTVGDSEDRIVASLSGERTVEDLDTAPEQDAYRAEVAAVLGSVEDFAVNTQWDFNRDEHNRRHVGRYPNGTTHGSYVFDGTEDDDGFRIETITYPELIHLVQQEGDFALLFGGTWCHNTAAIIKQTNDLAQKYGIKKVYNFDFSLSSTGNGGSDYLHIRDNANASGVGGQVLRPSHLYGDLVNDYLTNAVTQYRKNGDPGSGGTNFVAYYPGGDTTLPLAEARKIQVGHVLTYNKDRVDALGRPEPVIDQAIRQNDNGGNTEHMTEVWFVQGRDYPAGDDRLRGALNPTSQSGSNSLQSQRAFAKEGVDEIETLFKGFTTDIASTVAVTGITDGAHLPLGDTPTLDVTISADGYAPFISLYTANQNAAPPAVPETGKPRGFVALFDGDTEIAEARLTRQGTASFTLPPLTAGAQDLTIRYLGRGDLISPSEKVVNFTVVGDPSITTLTGPSSVFFGEAATFEATVAAEPTDEGSASADPTSATGTVRLLGLPGDAVEANLVEGKAEIEIPSTTPAGTYSVTARYLGDETYGVSDSDPLALTVIPDPTFSDVSKSHTFYSDIKWLFRNGIAGGYDDGTFQPGSPVTRQAVASFIYKFAGSPAFTAPATPTFSDVPTTHRFYTEIEWLAQSGIAGGYADGTFKPSGVVSRQAVASFLYKFAGSPAYTPASPSFTDLPSDHQFHTAVEWLASKSVISGYGDGTFKPGNAVTRQAAASFLHKYDTNV